MKKLFLFTFLVMSTLSFTAQASSQDCILKNLRKSQTLFQDGTNFIVHAGKANGNSSADANAVSRSN
jgi:hypothetical protein